MSWLLLLFGVFSFAMAANVIRPIYRHPKYMVYSFLFGWLAGELALHVIAFELALLLLVVLFGSLSGWLDTVSLLLIVGSWILLAYHYFSGFSSSAPFVSSMVSEQGSHNTSQLSWHRILRPIYHLKDRDLVVDKNIVYREIDGLNLKLDIRRRDRNVSNAPVLLQIHGGAWTLGYGSKNEQGLPLMQRMAQDGWVCVSIDYRLSPKATFPDHIIDCKYALAWVKDHIAEYGGNPNFIVVTGGSAGGHLSSLLALSVNEDRFHEGLEGRDLSVQGCVPFYGIYDLLDEKGLQNSVGLEIVMRKSIIKQTKQENPELYRYMSPISHIHADAPPFLVVHGDKDSLTSFAEAEHFTQVLNEVSHRDAKFVAIKGAQHAFEMFPSLRAEIVISGVAAELRAWYAEYCQRT